ncbi:putative repeat protein (TIGR03943 family) [Streptosporangium becharense]|uniref:Putative repeat protein (TIGR03943 family) n=1 Tax=Streptosporangium becharense TaxID=1816182 RepID=A0A7W9IHK9_9ACTN|nr:TIGR03943 family protein [Streptosporangium becharense]MBB2914936.1 putative repeat protein (TIGR03943 family) [Streptosporangium becharense]MBB5820253.1 putative repeat protein (TIGR03943 family) [Streptosporangium becharense]
MAAAVNRVTQNLVLTLLGCAVLRISAFSTTYLNYVKPGFRPFLIGAGAVLVILGVAGLFQATRVREASGGDGERARSGASGERTGDEAATESDDPSEGPSGDPAGDPSGGLSGDPSGGSPGRHGHDAPGDRAAHGPHDSPISHEPQDHHGHHGHSHGGPRVAWLMCLPVFAIFLIAPPALGSFAAAREDIPPPREQSLSAFTPLGGNGTLDMTIGEFIGRAWDDEKKSLTGREVRLTGFVVPAKKGQWYVTRMQIACCAADAFPLKVAVKDLPAPPADTWVEVTGTWIPQDFGKMPNGVVYPQLAGKSLMKIEAPDEPYE